MRLQVIILFLLATGCNKSKDYIVDEHPERILGEQLDSKGRLAKRVVTGIIPGEDTYLTITRFDSVGRVIEEYGAEPYGTKFKTTFKYNLDNQVTEQLRYSFVTGDGGHFENYQSDGFYEMTDTLVSFEGGVVDERTLFTYQPQDSLVIEHHYSSVYDSATSRTAFELARVDTVDLKTFKHQR
jgi:hypothetical protein